MHFPFPMYFAKRPLTGRLTLRVGDPFPVQEKMSIRGLGAAYGVANAFDLPFAELPYVDIVDVRSRSMAKRIRESAMGAKDVRKLLTAEAA